MSAKYSATRRVPGEDFGSSRAFLRYACTRSCSSLQSCSSVTVEDAALAVGGAALADADDARPDADDAREVAVLGAGVDVGAFGTGNSAKEDADDPVEEVRPDLAGAGFASTPARSLGNPVLRLGPR